MAKLLGQFIWNILLFFQVPYGVVARSEVADNLFYGYLLGLKHA